MSADHREKAREAIRTGKLPRRAPDAIWGGFGQSACCAICDAPVKRDDPELEIEFARADAPRPDKHHVHPRCFAAWQLELHAEGAISLVDASKPTGTGRVLQGAAGEVNIVGGGCEATSGRRSA